MSGRDLGVLSAQCGNHVGGLERSGLHLLGIQPDPHAVLSHAEDGHSAHAVDPGEFVLQVQGREIVKEEAVVLPTLRLEGDELENVGGFGLNDHTLCLDSRGELGQSGIDPVLHQDLIGVRIGTNLEGDGQRVVAVVRGTRLHVEHARHSVHLEFDGEGHLVDDGLGARSRIIGRHDDRGRSDLGKLADRKHGKRNPPEKHHHQGDNVRENRPFDEELRKHPARW